MTYDENKVDISLDEMSKLAKREYILLDIRSGISFSLGNIEGSLNRPRDEIDFRINELPRDKPIIVLCTMGVFSKGVTKKLRAHGCKAYNLLGGYGAWLVQHFQSKKPTCE